MDRLTPKDRISSLSALALIGALVAPPGAWAKGEDPIASWKQPSRAVREATKPMDQIDGRPTAPAQPIEVFVPECRPGEVLGELCGPGTGSSAEWTAVQYPESYEMPRAYDLFEADFSTNSLLRSYLLAFAAFSIYEPAYWGHGSTEKAARYEHDPLLQERIADGGDHLDLEAYLIPYLGRYGIHDVEVFSNPEEGAQAMVIANDDVVIVAFRGTQGPSSEDAPADWATNLEIFGEWYEGWGYVHAGDKEAFDSIRYDVTNAVIDHAPRKVWVTGHSMGGALATLAAMHFLDKGIDVEGVEVFGNPRALGFGAAVAYINTPLRLRTARWQVAGDPIPGLPDAGVTCLFWYQGYCLKTGDPFVFTHVGRVHNVTPEKTDPQTIVDYTIVPNLPDNEIGVSLLYFYGGFELEHAKYDDAIRADLEEELLGERGDALAEEWEVPSGDLFIDILPPLQLDPADR